MAVTVIARSTEVDWPDAVVAVIRQVTGAEVGVVGLPVRVPVAGSSCRPGGRGGIDGKGCRLTGTGEGRRMRCDGLASRPCDRT